MARLASMEAESAMSPEITARAYLPPPLAATSIRYSSRPDTPAFYQGRVNRGVHPIFNKVQDSSPKPLDIRMSDASMCVSSMGAP